MDDHLELTRLDPAYARASPTAASCACADRAAMAAEVARVCGPAEAERFDRYCDWLGRLCRLEVPSFLDRNYDHVTDLVRPLGPALGLLRLERAGSAAWPARAGRRVVFLLQLESTWPGLRHRALGCWP